MISTEALASMRATQTAALPSTCTITRKAKVPDGMGGYTESEVTVASGVACRLAILGATTEAIVAERYAGRQLWQLTLTRGQDTASDDRVTVDSYVYEVAGVNSGGAWETAERVILARVV